MVVQPIVTFSRQTLQQAGTLIKGSSDEGSKQARGRKKKQGSNKKRKTKKKKKKKKPKPKKKKKKKTCRDKQNVVGIPTYPFPKPAILDGFIVLFSFVCAIGVILPLSLNHITLWERFCPRNHCDLAEIRRRQGGTHFPKTSSSSWQILRWISRPCGSN